MKADFKKFLGLGLVAFVTWLAIYYWPAVSSILLAILSASRPLIFGAIIAYVVGILMDFFEKIWFP